MSLSETTRTRINLSLASIFDDSSSGPESALIGPDEHAFGELANAELELFPEMADLPTGNFGFWVVAEGGRVGHAMRLSFPTLASGLFAPNLAHELVDSGQITASQIAVDFANRGIELSQCISVESSFRVARLSPKSAALPSYLGLTQFVVDTNRTAVLAHQNGVAQRSFRRAGLYWEPLSPSYDLRTPSLANPMIPDERYWPIVLPLQGKNQALLASMAEHAPTFVEHFIDLRSRATQQPA